MSWTFWVARWESRPASAGDTDSVPSVGRSHVLGALCAAAAEPVL